MDYKHAFFSKFCSRKSLHVLGFYSYNGFKRQITMKKCRWEHSASIDLLALVYICPFFGQLVVKGVVENCF